MDIRLLGPIEVLADGSPLELGGPQPRALVAHLALDHGRVVSVERLVARLWGEQPPTSPLASLQTTLSRLRRVLEPDRVPGAPPAVIASEAPGYVLRVPPDAVDVMRFRGLALDGRRAAAAALHSEARRRFEAALAEWRGPALGGIGPDDVVVPIALALDEERLAVVQDRFDVLLALGLHVETIAELSVAVGEQPLREGLWSALAIALYRSQRQADALRAIDQARRTLVDELGLDPAPVYVNSSAAFSITTRHCSPFHCRPRQSPQPRRNRGRRSSASSVATPSGAVSSPRSTEPLTAIRGSCCWRATPASASRRSPSDCSNMPSPRAGGRPSDAGSTAIWLPRSGRSSKWCGRWAATCPASGRARVQPCEPAVEIADQVLEVVDRQASGSGWCVLLDDVHWADRLTLEVLALLAERLGDRRVLVVAAFRPVATVPDSPLHDMIGALNRVPGGERLLLPPLGENDVAEILRRTTGSIADTRCRAVGV